MSLNTRPPIVIVGSGQAAASFISRHARLDDPPPLVLIGEEPYAPYQRPPLSKNALLGSLDLDRLFIRTPPWYAEQGVVTRFNTRIREIRRSQKQVICDQGDSVQYSKLILCTGARARTLPDSMGGHLDGVFTLRTIADMQRLQPVLQPGHRLLIVGGGYIGLEVAATARQLGLEVTLLEMADRILQRVAARETSDFFRALHREHGVDLRESTVLTRLTGVEGRVRAAELESGETMDTDLVLVGIGSQPNTALADSAGLECDNGIAVTETGQTSDPDIYAAGDCTSFVRNGVRVRLESVQNAADQGDLVARVLGKEEARYTAVPWFWSEQYDCRLQIVGLNHGHNRTVVRPGGKHRSQSVWYYADERLLAIDAMNDTLSYAFGRRMITLGKHPSPSQVADPGVDLKTLFRELSR